MGYLFEMANNTTHKDELAELLHLSARKRDTLHLLVIVLRQQAQVRGDMATAFLIDNVLGRQHEGDPVKLELMKLLRKSDSHD